MMNTMNISFEKKILLGYIINLITLLAVGLIYWSHMFNQVSILWNWISLGLILLCVGMITVVYVIIITQLKAKNKIERLLLENEKLVQSIIDNTTNLISVKKINGEYLLINKQYGLLFNFKKEQIEGKTDHDLFSKEIADKYRSADLEAVKLGKQLHLEEIIEQEDGTHTYLSVKFPLMDSSNRVFAVGTISTDITESKAISESLKVADVFFNLSQDMLIIASENTFLKINPVTSKTLGFSEEELLGKPFISFVHPVDVESTLKEIEKLKTGVITINFEDRFVCKDGSYKWLNWTVYPDVKTNLLYAVARDVTLKKEYETKLLAAENFFNMSQDMLIIASENTFLKINPATSKTLGFSEEELLGKPFTSFIHPDDLDKTFKEVEKLKTGAITINFENRYLCKDGSYKWVNWTTYPDVKTNLLYAVARDVSINKKKEATLIAADKFFNMSLDLLIIASNDKFIKVNPAIIKLLGYSESELLSKPFSTFIFPEDLSDTEKTIKKLQKGTPFINIKNRIVCKDGSVKWLSWSVVVDSKTELLYAVARDITEQLKQEQKDKEALEESYENEQKLTTILENIGDGVLVADSNRNVMLANYMANEMFGVEEDSKIPVNFSDGFELFFPDEKTTFPVQNLPMERALKGEATDDIDLVLWSPISNEKKRVLLSGRPIIDLQKNVVAAVITIKDISKYKMMEKELLESRKLIGFKKNID